MEPNSVSNSHVPSTTTHVYCLWIDWHLGNKAPRSAEWKTSEINWSKFSSNSSQAWLKSCWERGQLLDNHEGVQQHPKILYPFLSRNIVLLLGRHRPLCTPSIRKASDYNSLLATKSLCWHCFHLKSFKTLKQISHLQASQGLSTLRNTTLFILRLEFQNTINKIKISKMESFPQNWVPS